MFSRAGNYCKTSLLLFSHKNRISHSVSLYYPLMNVRAILMASSIYAKTFRDRIVSFF